MQASCRSFRANARGALADAALQRALGNLRRGFPDKRAAAIARLPEFDALCECGREIKDHVIAHLDYYLERFAAEVEARGGQVHWARDAAEAREAVLAICRAVGATTVTKGKSMVSEEIGLNDWLERHGITPIETDLGEYILQLRGDSPSHIIAPAIHLNLEQVADAFHEAHRRARLSEPRALMNEAREVLRGPCLHGLLRTPPRRGGARFGTPAPAT